MISLVLIELMFHPWTSFGTVVVYALLLVAVLFGIALHFRSSGLYFGLGWLIFIALPLFALSVIERSFGARAIFRNGGFESIYLYIYLWIALVELAFIWVPLIGRKLRHARGKV